VLGLVTHVDLHRTAKVQAISRALQAVAREEGLPLSMEPPQI